MNLLTKLQQWCKHRLLVLPDYRGRGILIGCLITQK